MKHSHKAAQFMRTQKGFSLIEVMVSLTIGLFIMVGIGAAYLNSANLSQQRENQSELNEPARLVMRLLQQNISKAGYVDVFDVNADTTRQATSLFIPAKAELVNMFQKVPSTAAVPVPVGTPLGQFFPGMFPVFGCDGLMNGTPNAMVNSAIPAVLNCGAASTVTHSLQLAYQASPGLTPPALVNSEASLLAVNPATGEGADCLQQAPPGTAVAPRDKFVVNRFFVAAKDGINELYCAGSGNPIPQPLARGVEEFMLRYQVAQAGVAPAVGIVSVAAGGSQSQYLNATGVSNVLLNPVGWANVTAVEICVVSATPNTSGSAAGTAQIQPLRPTCGRTATGTFAADVARANGDTRLWKRFTSVISVRNAVYASSI